MERYVLETPMLDFSSQGIKKVLKENGWENLGELEKIKGTYDFVQNQIQFGYNIEDALDASKVLENGYGQCNTKNILLMSLLRGLQVSCRLHGYLIDKKVQKGVAGLAYKLMPEEIVHTMVEVLYEGNWYMLEGCILDEVYLNQIKKKQEKGFFYGYGVGTKEIENPLVEWKGENTFIQFECITSDLGIYNSPDEFFREHQQKMSPLKEWFFKNITRHKMNRNVESIRRG